MATDPEFPQPPDKPVVPLPDKTSRARGFGAGRRYVNDSERDRRRVRLEEAGYACYSPHCIHTANTVVDLYRLDEHRQRMTMEPETVKACRVHRKPLLGTPRRYEVVGSAALPPRPTETPGAALHRIRRRRENIHDEVLDLEDALAALDRGNIDEARELLDYHPHHRDHQPRDGSPSELRAYIQLAQEKASPRQS